MKSPTESDASASALLSRYAHLKLSSANEAETRLKLIDRIFFGLLDWAYEDVTVEDRFPRMVSPPTPTTSFVQPTPRLLLKQKK